MGSTRRDGHAEYVYFWHLVGGRSHTYKQMGTPNILGAINDMQKHGFHLRKEQFFIRLSSNEILINFQKNPF